jgi:hypothetical protein
LFGHNGYKTGREIRECKEEERKSPRKRGKSPKKTGD